MEISENKERPQFIYMISSTDLKKTIFILPVVYHTHENSNCSEMVACMALHDTN